MTADPVPAPTVLDGTPASKSGEHTNPVPVRGTRRRVIVWPALLLASGLVVGGYLGWDSYRARREWRGAEAAIHRYELAEAAPHLDRYVALRPGDPAGWLRAAQTARRRGRFADAKRYLAEFENVGGAPAPARLERDLLLVQQGELGDIDARLRATIDPDHPDVLFILEALARGYLIAERWPDARQACELWRALDPGAHWPWLWGGWVAERMVQIEQASEFYTRAVELRPEDRDARVALARLLVRLRKPAAAAPHYEWVLARAPEDADALLGLAQCRLDEGRAGDAAPLLERARVREPDSPLVVVLSGRAAADLGDAAAAERWYRRAVQSEPSNAEALHLLVQCLRGQQKDAEADRLAHQLEALQKDLRRLTELVRAIGPQLTDSGPCHEAGVIALRIGRTQQGLNLLRDGLRRTGDHRAIHAALAAHYRQTGRPDLVRYHQNLSEAP